MSWIFIVFCVPFWATLSNKLIKVSISMTSLFFVVINCMYVLFKNGIIISPAEMGRSSGTPNLTESKWGRLCHFGCWGLRLPSGVPSKLCWLWQNMAPVMCFRVKQSNDSVLGSQAGKSLRTEGSTVNIWGLAGQPAMAVSSQLCCCLEGPRPGCRGGGMWLCSSAALLSDAEMWIFFGPHVSQNVIILLTFSHHGQAGP